MKYLLSFILITSFFVGCSVKQLEVDLKLPNKTDIGTQIKPVIVSKDKALIVDDSKALEEIEIIENTIPMKLAFIYPSKLVSKYAKSSMNTVLGYFDYKKIKYEIKVFDTLNEDVLNIENAFLSAKEQGYENIIALFTPNTMQVIHSIDTSDLRVYLPLASKRNIEFINENFIYGAISYEDQIKKLLEYSSSNNIMFYQSSFLGNKLKTLYETISPDVKLSKEIKKKKNDFKDIVKDNRLKNSTLFLNTPIVKTSILLSQLRSYDIQPKVILSTQINYNPKILTLTQVKDRSNFVLANSIDKVDDSLRDTISTFGADIQYNWVDYSTLVGINYLYDENESSLIQTHVLDNEVIYEPRLLITTAYGFLEIK